MKIKLVKYKRNSELRKKLKELYTSAFPKNERAPFALIMSKGRGQNADMLAAYDGDTLVGFAYMVCYMDLAYLFYLAIDEPYRGKGYGTAILAEIKNNYRDMRIFLAREMLDKDSNNYAQRVSRRDFYLRNGFQDLPCQIKEASVTYDVMGINGNISANDYDKLITAWSGRFLRRMIDMRVIEK